jgi:hypothetical protein
MELHQQLRKIELRVDFKPATGAGQAGPCFHLLASGRGTKLADMTLGQGKLACIPNVLDSPTRDLTRLRTFVELGKQARMQRELLAESRRVPRKQRLSEKWKIRESSRRNRLS